MSVKDILKVLMDKHGDTQYSLWKTTGVPQPTIGRILTGESKNPATKTLLPIADHYNISIDQLLGKVALDGDKAPIQTPAARYAIGLTKEALELASVWQGLRRSSRFLLRERIFREAAMDWLMPWMKPLDTEGKTWEQIKESMHREYEKHMRHLEAQMHKMPSTTPKGKRKKGAAPVK